MPELAVFLFLVKYKQSRGVTYVVDKRALPVRPRTEYFAAFCQRVPCGLLLVVVGVILVQVDIRDDHPGLVRAMEDFFADELRRHSVEVHLSNRRAVCKRPNRETLQVRAKDAFDDMAPDKVRVSWTGTGAFVLDRYIGYGRQVYRGKSRTLPEDPSLQELRRRCRVECDVCERRAVPERTCMVVAGYADEIGPAGDGR